MKRCPTCNRSFDDDTLSFCLEDGTPLVRDTASRADSQETLVSPPPFGSPAESGTASPPTQNYGQLPGKATVSASQFYVPPAQAPVPLAPPAKRRRAWPWIVGILLIVLILIGGIVIAVMVIPSMLSVTPNRSPPHPTPTPGWTTTPTPKASPSEEADDVPDDEGEVLSQLNKLEDEWARANVKGDKQALERILADEYSGGENSHSKREYIDSITPDTTIKSWEIKDLTLEQEGDRATVHGTLTNETTTGTQVYSFADKFVWRDHRWQAVSSQTRSVK
jgi:hypothetical protein